MKNTKDPISSNVKMRLAGYPLGFPQKQKAIDIEQEQPIVVPEPLEVVEKYFPEISKEDAVRLYQKYFSSEIQAFKDGVYKETQEKALEAAHAQGVQENSSLIENQQKQLQALLDTINTLQKQVKWQFSDQEQISKVILEAVVRMLERELSDVEKQYESLVLLFEEYAGDQPKKIFLAPQVADQLNEYIKRKELKSEMLIEGKETLSPGSFELRLVTGSVEKDLNKILDNFKEGLLTLCEVEE